ncbi:MAG: transcription antitermination factor NusB [Deltaproteobacteria bacterium]|nr:MAG: transcription antitermination factor NusB [Deltaproteobacteria bacterium]
MGARHKKRAARELALLAAYAGDCNGDWDDAVAVVDATGDGAALQADHLAELRSVQGARSYARRLIDAYLERRAEIDERIERTSERWRLDRMDRIDRNVLRLALAEASMDPAPPHGVLMSEWVDLASRYGSERSGGFVNGLLRSTLADPRRIQDEGDVSGAT